MGGIPRGETLARHDGSGALKQLLARGYAAVDAAEACFPKYVQRPLLDSSQSDVAITFAGETSEGFCNQIENAVAAGDNAPFFDFERMPNDWRVPEPLPLDSLSAC